MSRWEVLLSSGMATAGGCIRLSRRPSRVLPKSSSKLLPTQKRGSAPLISIWASRSPCVPFKRLKVRSLPPALLAVGGRYPALGRNCLDASHASGHRPRSLQKGGKIILLSGRKYENAILP